MKTKHLLVLFLLMFCFNKSKAQCGGVLSISTSKTIVCAEDTLTIIVSLSGGGIGWDFKIYSDSLKPNHKISDTTFVIDSPGNFNTHITYYATADSSGCSQKTDSISITELALLQAPEICSSQDTFFVFNALTYKSYQWYFNGSPIPGATIYYCVITQVGNYNVYATDSNGCSRLGNGFAFPSSCDFSEVKKLYDLSLINFYPNPLTSSSNLHFTTRLNNTGVIIYDMLGKEMRKRFSGNEMEIEKGSLSGGVYLVRVNAGEREFVQKLIVE